MKRASLLLFASFLGVVFVALFLLFVQVNSVEANPGIRYVGPGANCGSKTPCYGKIQTAVDAAASGDEIRVAAGTYTDVEARPRRDTTNTGVVTQTVYLRKTLTIRGGYNPTFTAWNPSTYATILNPNGHGRAIYITGNITPTIIGLRMTDGDATGLAGYDYAGTHDVGGAVYIMTATASLDTNQISNSRAEFGGGVFLNESRARLINNRIFENDVITGGGGVGVYHQPATLESNQIYSNTSSNMGGGVYLFGAHGILRNNIIKANSTNNFGGGVDVASCDPTFIGNIFVSNTARTGGGLYLWYSRSWLTNNVIMDNHSSYPGSGLAMGGSQLKLWHTTIARNIGGGSDTGVYAFKASPISPSTVVMTNTILVDHSVGISIETGSAVTLNGILWFSTPVTVFQEAGATLVIHHAYNGDPAFGVDGYHLKYNSAARNKGVQAGVLTDIDGQPRFASLPDLGADEFWASGYPKFIYLPLIRR